MQRHRVSLAVLALALLVIVASCTPSSPAVPATALPATKTPKPTFTPTTAVTPTRLLIPTATQQPTQAPTKAPATATPEPTQTPQPQPTDTPVPEAQFSPNQNMNVRQGPGTNYPTIGQVSAGNDYKIMGKNRDSSWFQFNFEGDPGWVSAQLVSTSGDMDAVQVAQNIPQPPPPPTAAPVQVRVEPTKAPPAAPAPTAAPVSRYKYSRARIDSCRPQAGGTWFNGYVLLGGQKQNGDTAVFSWAPDAQPVASVVVGPHPGYPGWDPGYFSHIVNDVPGKPRAGDWYIWVTDGAGNRISEIVRWHSDGPVAEGTGCNDATIVFEG